MPRQVALTRAMVKCFVLFPKDCHLSAKLISSEEGTEKYGRKTLAAKRLRSFEFGLALFKRFRCPGIGGLSEYGPILKIFAIYVKISTL
jgi:hypothetical protein